MNILRKIWEAVRKLFTRDKTMGAAEKMQVKPAVNGEMLERMQLWNDMWKERAYWLDEKNGIESLNIEKDAVKEFANTVTNEMSVTISNPQLQVIFDRSVRNLSEELQEGMASGALVIKPLGGNKVQFVSQFDFLPTEYDSEKRLTGVIFPDCTKIGDKYYTRLEYHHIGKDGLTIENKAFVSKDENSLGREITLAAVDAWAALPEAVVYPIDRPIYGYYRNPIKNTIDNSNVGVSAFDSAIVKIKRADIQGARIDWEFESAERAVHVSEVAVQVKRDENGLPVSTVPKGKERLYRGLDIDEGSGDLFKEYSPTLRQKDFIEGLEEQKREIEFSMCLAYGDLSNANTVDKTATEMKISRQRKYNMVTAMQENLKDCLEDLCYGLAFMNQLANSGYEFTCNFHDSITTDEETERKQDIQDVQMGIMRPEEYRAKWYGEDEQTALNNLPQTAQVIE